MIGAAGAGRHPANPRGIQGRRRPAARADPGHAGRYIRRAVHRETRNQLIGLGVLAAVLAGGYAARQALGIEWSPETVRARVADFGLWGPAVFVTLLTFRMVIMIPSQVLLIAAGLCFGALAGTLYGVMGITLSAAIAFGFVRWIGRDVVLSRVPPRLRHLLDSAGRSMGAVFVLLATAYPFGPITAWHAGAGLTGMTFLVFVLAVASGSAVRSLTYTWFGSSLVAADLWQIALATLALGAVTGLPLLHPRSRRFVGEMLNPGRGARDRGAP